jgi:hypothetical protein
MHARLTRFKGDPAKLEEGIRLIKEQVIPSAKKMAGFKGGYWLIDRKSGAGFALTLFDSEAAVQASEEASKKLRDQVTSTGVSQVTAVERYEVIAQA